MGIRFCAIVFLTSSSSFLLIYSNKQNNGIKDDIIAIQLSKFYVVSKQTVLQDKF